MKPGPNVEPRQLNTSLFSLRQMNVEGTENAWANLEQAGLVYP